MITIHSFAMAALIDKRQPLDLIDVRTKQEFRSFHIRGAQSFPLRELSAAKLLQRRKRETTEALYIICNNRIRASQLPECLLPQDAVTPLSLMAE
jgi:rhodanese-related sulfurtransferase